MLPITACTSLVLQSFEHHLCPLGVCQTSSRREGTFGSNPHLSALPTMAARDVAAVMVVTWDFNPRERFRRLAFSSRDTSQREETDGVGVAMKRSTPLPIPKTTFALKVSGPFPTPKKESLKPAFGPQLFYSERRCANASILNKLCAWFPPRHPRFQDYPHERNNF